MSAIYRYMGIAGAFIIVIVAASAWSYHKGSQSEKNAMAAQILAQAQRSATENAALTKQLAAARAKRQIVYQTLTKEVPHETTVYEKVPGATEYRVIRVPVFVSVGFVSLWNDALLGTLPGPTSNPDAAGTQSSTVDASALLTNHTRNSERCLANSTQLDQLIHWVRNNS